MIPKLVVLHLHPVEALTHLVRDDCEEVLPLLLGHNLSWIILPYHQPGSTLAAALKAALRPGVDLVLLKNHGIIVAGDDIDEVQQKTAWLMQQLAQEAKNTDIAPPASRLAVPDGYALLPSQAIQQLALRPELFQRLHADWALYPDQVVFLGPVAHAYDSWNDFARDRHKNPHPKLVFIRNQGVFSHGFLSSAQMAQLDCYYEVMRRQTRDVKLTALSAEQIHTLCNWDAEHYRQVMQR
jgi:rhamnose utilization protein RhaD (predicted bifunctional aldolase and dehydrogenase)